ncbi:hypothetical protein DB346_19015 [Verrucomicrobia bacterium LW23]|nr:hypothetical protein DB346_19015 [Verrucomicrobia bacterium LW23]
MRILTRYWILTLAIVAMMATSSMSAHASAQEALDLAIEIGKEIYKKYGIKPFSEDSGFLDTGKQKVYKLTLYEGLPYTFIVTGSKEVEKLEVGLFDEAEKLVLEGTTSENGRVATLPFKPTATAIYYLAVQMSKSTGTGGNFYVLQYNPPPSKDGTEKSSTMNFEVKPLLAYAR